MGVPLILSGRLRAAAGTVRIETELVRTSDGRILRRETFERETGDLDGTHEGLIQDFADLVGYKLEPDQLKLWRAEGPRDAVAFQDYLVGLGLMSEQKYEQAREKLRSALDGPQGGLAFAAAARGLGDVNRHLFSRTGDARWAREAERAYRQAAAVPSVDLYSAWGTLAQAEGDYEEAVRQHDEALSLDPFDYWSYRQLVLSYEALGDRAAAREVLSTAVERQPGCWRIWNFTAKRQALAGDLHGSEQSLLKVIQLAPRNPIGYNNLAFDVYLPEGRYIEVIDLAAKAIAIIDGAEIYLTLGLGYFFTAALTTRYSTSDTPLLGSPSTLSPGNASPKRCS